MEIVYLPNYARYFFSVETKSVFTHSAHPSLILSCPPLMLSPSDLAKPEVPCDSSTLPILDSWRNKAFYCRVVHSSTALLSAAEIINESGQVVATTPTINPSTLAGMGDIQGNTIYLDEGERAFLVRGNNDWAICIGKWEIDSLAAAKRSPKYQYFVGIKVFKLFGERGWCSVDKFSHGDSR